MLGTHSDHWIDDPSLSLPAVGFCDALILCHPLVEQLNELMVVESVPNIQCQQLEPLLHPHPGPQDPATCSWKGDRKQSLFSFKKKNVVELIAILM